MKTNKVEVYHKIMECISNKIINELQIFKISHIPLYKKQQQYIDYKFTHITPTDFLDPLYHKNITNRLYENAATYTVPLSQVKKSICRKYKLQEWQYIEFDAYHDHKLCIIIPKIGKNEEMIINDMESLGYFCGYKELYDDPAGEYIGLRFEPMYQTDDITNTLREYGYLLHITLTKNLDSIYEHGLIAQHKNNKFNYPPRLYFFPSNLSKMELITIVKMLNDELYDNSIYLKDFSILLIDMSKINPKIKFYGDPISEKGVFTTDNIPADAIIDNTTLMNY